MRAYAMEEGVRACASGDSVRASTVRQLQQVRCDHEKAQLVGVFAEHPVHGGHAPGTVGEEKKQVQ